MDKTDKKELFDETLAFNEEINRRMPHKESLAYLLAVLGCHHFHGNEVQDGLVNLDCWVKDLALRSGEALPLLVKPAGGGIHHPEFLGKDRQRYTLFEAKYEDGRILVQAKAGQQPIVWLTIKDLLSRLPLLTRIKGICTPH